MPIKVSVGLHKLGPQGIPSPGGAVQVSGDAFGASVAGDTANLGAAVADTGGRIAVVMDRWNLRRESARALREENALAERMRLFLDEAGRNNRGCGAAVVPGMTDAQADRLMTEARAGIRDQRVLFDFDQRMASRKKAWMNEAYDHAFKQDELFRAETVQAALLDLKGRVERGASLEEITAGRQEYEQQARALIPEHADSFLAHGREQLETAQRHAIIQGIDALIADKKYGEARQAVEHESGVFGEASLGKRQLLPKGTLPANSGMTVTDAGGGLPAGLHGALRPSDVPALRTKIEAAEAHEIRLQEHEIKRQREGAEKELYAIAFDGGLSRESVEARRDILSPHEYEKFLKLTRGDSVLPDKSNPAAIVELTNMAVNGDAGLQEYADEKILSGELTIGDYRAAINEGQQFRDPAIKQVMDDMKNLTGTSELNPPAGARESFVNAKRDFFDWLDSEQGKKASPKERLEMGRMIAERYRASNTEKTLLSTPLPLSLVGTKTQPDIPGTVRKIEADRVAGKLTDEQYRQEMIRVKRLADILKDRAERQREDAARRSSQR